MKRCLHSQSSSSPTPYPLSLTGFQPTEGPRRDRHRQPDQWSPHRPVLRRLPATSKSSEADLPYPDEGLWQSERTGTLKPSASSPSSATISRSRGIVISSPFVATTVLPGLPEASGLRTSSARIRPATDLFRPS